MDYAENISLSCQMWHYENSLPLRYLLCQLESILKLIESQNVNFYVHIVSFQHVTEAQLVLLFMFHS